MTTNQAPALSTPMAIVLGSVIIAAGLFFGLRGGRNDAPVPMGPPVANVSSVVKPMLDRSEALQPSSSSVDRQRVLREAVAVLAQYKKALTDKCLAPALAKKPDPPLVRFRFNITFNAEGKPIARGIRDDRETARPEVTNCVNENFPQIIVTPPGQSVLVDVPLELP